VYTYCATFLVAAAYRVNMRNCYARERETIALIDPANPRATKCWMMMEHFPSLNQQDLSLSLSLTHLSLSLSLSLTHSLTSLYLSITYISLILYHIHIFFSLSLFHLPVPLSPLQTSNSFPLSYFPICSLPFCSLLPCFPPLSTASFSLILPFSLSSFSSLPPPLFPSPLSHSFKPSLFDRKTKK